MVATNNDRRPPRRPGPGLATRPAGETTAVSGSGLRRRVARWVPVAAAPSVRLPRHRSTTRNLVAAYPFQAEAGLGGRGTLLGTNVLAGGGAFCYDPFEAYTQGMVDGPNMIVAGMVGSGKSASTKMQIFRSVGVFGSPGGAARWVVIYDPKGEYTPLAEALGLHILRLRPGGATRINPLDPGPGSAGDDRDALLRCRAELVSNLLSSVLRRDLTQLEHSVLGWIIAGLTDSKRIVEPTLEDVARALLEPPDKVLARARCGSVDDFIDKMTDVRLCLGRLLDGSLKGMFDGRTTERVDWAGRGLVIDVSAVFHDSVALPLVMLCATSWTQQVFTAHAEDNRRRYQLIDECWAVLRDEHTAKSFQAAWKLSRTYGVSNIAVVHRISDLGAQADTGTSASKVAEGLLSDSDTRVLFRQPNEEMDTAVRSLGLTSTEAALLPRLVKGRALWKVKSQTAVVQHQLTGTELAITNTDGNMTV